MGQQQQRAERPALPRDVEVEAARGRIEHWRQTRLRGSAMPVELWVEAVCLARKRSVYSISQALGVGFKVLQKRVDLAAAVNHAGAAAGTNGFVELKLAPPGESCVASGAVLELSRADGARLEFRFPAHEPVDVLGLVAAFVGRGA